MRHFARQARAIIHKMDGRKKLLLELLSPRRQIALIRDDLSKSHWDCDTELVMLNRTHLKEVLGSFIAGSLTVADIETWAETVEGRDDFGFEKGHEKQLKAIAFELATQAISRPLSPNLALLFIDEISK